MRRLKAFSLLALAPAVAYAHGEQVIALPVGQAVALALLLVFGCLLSFKAWGRLMFFLCPLIVIAGTWFMSGDLGADATPYFLVGLIPPVVVAAASYAWFRKKTSSEAVASYWRATRRGGGIAGAALVALLIWYRLIIPFFTVEYGPASNLAFGFVTLGQLAASILFLVPCFEEPRSTAWLKTTALSFGLTIAQVFVTICLLMVIPKQ